MAGSKDNLAATGMEAKTEKSRPTRTYSAPAFPVQHRLTQENLRIFESISGDTQLRVQTTDSQSLEPLIPDSRSITEAEEERSVGGMPMERQGARRGDVGGSLGTPSRISVSSQNLQEQETAPSRTASDPGMSHQNSQTPNHLKMWGGEPMVRGGGFYCQGNGPNPGEKRPRHYYEPPSKAPTKKGT
ncbi:hypothetical protein N431DRAFT_444604 [Stipitochalara longipes BDJ]|nr:hypothetical protein N431DRAFT_444604 [Stipitochalara longipes BDJ]